MGQDKANVERTTHFKDGVLQDQSVTFHFGTESIDETFTDPTWWDEVRDAARGTNAQDWIDAVATVKAAVSFDWDDYPNQWKNSLRACFRD